MKITGVGATLLTGPAPTTLFSVAKTIRIAEPSPLSFPSSFLSDQFASGQTPSE
jgi:hypothetical protein